MAKTTPLSRKKTNQFMLVAVLFFLFVFIVVALAQISNNYSARQGFIQNTTSAKSQDLIKSFFSQKGSGQ